MSAQILNGRTVSEKIAVKLRRQIGRSVKKPGLAIIQIGNLAGSNLYIKRKIKFAEKIGARVRHLQYPKSITSKKLISQIQKLNRERAIHGIIVQLPLPPRLKPEQVVGAIDLSKDVDGLKPGSTFTPATARGVISLLEFYGHQLAGKQVTVIGRSALVGKPIALACLAKNATVTVCHRQTTDLATITKRADILIVAAGQPGLITARHVSPGQIVVDVGINLVTGQKLEDEIPKQKLVGDVNFSAVAKVVAAISPVPGGVGPLTVVSLFANLVFAAAHADTRH